MHSATRALLCAPSVTISATSHQWNMFCYPPSPDGQGPLFRCESEVKSLEWLKEIAAKPNCRTLFIHSENSVAIESNALVFRVGPVPPSLFPRNNSPVYFLGLSTVERIPHFACRMESEEEFKRQWGEAEELPQCEREVMLREAMVALSPTDAYVAALACSLLHWHSTVKFCGKCGKETSVTQGGRTRECEKAFGGCGSQFFPRTDPVAIMLLCSPDGEQCILGRSQRHKRIAGDRPVYSVLAGFIDQAESLEGAVCREVMEEAGIAVRPNSISYFASQPWPFPSNLMIGCFAVADTAEINFDKEEMVDVMWVPKAEAAAAIAEAQASVVEGNAWGRGAEQQMGTSASRFILPPPMTIAHSLLRHWVSVPTEEFLKRFSHHHAKL